VARLGGMFWPLALAAFFGLFVWMVWRVSAGPSNEEPALGNNLPYASNQMGQWGPFARMAGAPEPGTPESLEHSDPDTELRRMHHRKEWDEERRD